MKTAAILALLASTACGLLTPRAAGRAPLEDEGEVVLYLLPWPTEASRLSFSLTSIAAVRSDGTVHPLQVFLSDLPGRDGVQERLFARGTLPPGDYRALEVVVRRASTLTPEGRVELLVGSEPVSLEAGFQVRARRASVLTLGLRYEASVQATYAFTPRFAIAAPPRPMPQLAAVVANTSSNDLTVIDRHARTVSAVVPTGREPRGVTLGPGLARMYVAVSAEDRIAAFDLATSEPLPGIPLTAGDRPLEVAASPDGRTLLVLNGGSNSLAFIDPVGGAELSRLATGTDPVSMLVDRSWRRAYVLNQGTSTVTVVDLATRTVAQTVPTEPQPLRAQLNRAGDRLYVIHSASPQMLVLSLPDFRVLNRVTVGLGAAALKVDPRSDLIYLAVRDDPRVYVYDAFSLIPLDRFDVPAGPTWLAIDDSENTLLGLMPSIGATAVVDLTSRRVLGIVPVGEDPYSIAVAGERF